MSMTLTIEDIAALKAIQNAEPDDPVLKHIPQRLFVYGLITRRPFGEVLLTKGGERRLFQQSCCDALRGLALGVSLLADSGTGRWLSSSGFVVRNDDTGAFTMTRRGKVWLDSFDQDTPVQAPPPSADGFARRRDLAI